MNRDILCHEPTTSSGSARMRIRRRCNGGNGLIVLLCGALFLASLTAQSVASSQRGGPGAEGAYQSGVVTSLLGSRIEIDNTYYRLHKLVTVTDDEGTVLTLKDLGSGARVRFHLKGGQVDRIILMLPR